MHLTRHSTTGKARWALDGNFLPESFSLCNLMKLPASEIPARLLSLKTDEAATGTLLAPADPTHEIWASGVTYLSSRLAREAESQVADVYQLVYNAARPELFFKAIARRAIDPGQPIRIRDDSDWNTPEPELTLVINSAGEIIGHTIGNDVSSRSIEGENPLYLPQAKVYNGSCAIGPGIVIDSSLDLAALDISLEITREGKQEFIGETSTSNIKRPLTELVEYLYRELDFPEGAFLMTGTGIIPDEPFTLSRGDHVKIMIGGLALENTVA